MAPLIGCGRPRCSATRAAIPTGQSAPGEMIPSTSRALREPLDPRLVLGRDHRALVREGEPGRERVAVDRDHREVAGRRGLEQAELRRAGA